MRRFVRAVGRHLWTGLGLLAFGSWYTPPWQWTVPSSARRRRKPAAAVPPPVVVARSPEPDVPLTAAEHTAWLGLERRLLASTRNLLPEE
jgi:hypothetical protein